MIPLVHIFLKPVLSFISLICRLINIPIAIKAEESIVNLAITQSDEAKAKKDKCIEFNLIFY